MSQTTTEFLMHMGLTSVKDLPEFEKLINIKLIDENTQLNFLAEDGIYFLTITISEKESYTEKIILQQEK